ncbi:MAG: hypothetical protein SFX18_09070 [Pirellulales bacterium]|nr:hypothetical protein [Pirellulales bacterium]
MKLFSSMLALVVALGVSSLNAAELKSGPQVGEEVGAYEVTKCAGNSDDGVSEGDKLCYRCKMGNRPVVMIFSRQADAKVGKLLTQLDKVVAENTEKKLASFVNLIGDDVEKNKTAMSKMLTDGKVNHIAVVVPDDQQNGPAEYKIAPEAAVTVLIYKGGVVAANHAVTADGLNDEAIKSIIADTSKILN